MLENWGHGWNLKPPKPHKTKKDRLKYYARSLIIRGRDAIYARTFPVQFGNLRLLPIK